MATPRQIIITVLVAVAALLAYGGWRYLRARNAPLTDRGAIKQMKIRSEEAVKDAAKDFHIELDFSSDSIEKVEAIVAKIHDRHSKSPLEQTELTKESLKWGAYIGEVIKTVRHSEWALDSKVGGAGSLPIVYDRNGGESFPVRWCYKRIIEGPEENVWHKFQVFIIERDNPALKPENLDQKTQKNETENAKPK